MLLQFLVVLFLLPAAAVLAYYLALPAAAAIRPPARPRASLRQTMHSFAILIPAHDEENQIAATLQSCRELDYPPEKFRIFVIADNCSDGTASIARRMGSACLVRNDPQHRGKGTALAWALQHILPLRPDAVLVLDADCRIDRHALRTFDSYLSTGHPVLQACNIAANPEESLTSYVTSVGNAIENHLFYAPKSQLGLAVTLRGTGMVFALHVLERCPWQAGSIVEDAEYTIQLYRQGIPVAFVPEACVRSAFPVQEQQLQVQRARWIGGNSRLAFRHVIPLLAAGLIQRRAVLFDLAWTLLVSARSLVAGHMLLTGLLAMLAVLMVPGWFSLLLLAASIALMGLHAVYLIAGAWQMGWNGRKLWFLVQSPLTVIRLMQIAVSNLAPWRQGSWQRTPR